MLEKLQAEVDGQKIFYLQKGKQGPPIIFIHGNRIRHYIFLGKLDCISVVNQIIVNQNRFGCNLEKSLLTIEL